MVKSTKSAVKRLNRGHRDVEIETDEITDGILIGFKDTYLTVALDSAPLQDPQVLEGWRDEEQ